MPQIFLSNGAVVVVGENGKALPITSTQEIVVRHITDQLNSDRLRIEVEQNSRGTNIQVGYRGDNEDEVVATIGRVFKKMRAELES